MCGIVAVVRRRGDTAAPALAALADALDRSHDRLVRLAGEPDPVSALQAIAAELGAVDKQLRGVGALGACLHDRVALVGLEHRADLLQQAVTRAEAHLDGEIAAGRLTDVEAVNATLVACKDVVWAIGRDRL